MSHVPRGQPQTRGTKPDPPRDVDGLRKTADAAASRLLTVLSVEVRRRESIRPNGRNAEEVRAQRALSTIHRAVLLYCTALERYRAAVIHEWRPKNPK